MSNRFKLSIDNPCSQKWTDFEDRGDRGFCASCQKEVIDFTRLSDSEIRDYFKNRPENVCGQFKSYQLRTYSNPRANSGLSKWLSWPIAASALLFSSVTAHAQEKDKKELTTSVLVNESGPKVGGAREVQGVVTDENGEGLPGVNVVIKGTNRSITTDLDGNYRIDVPNNRTVLVFSSVGVITNEVVVGDRMIVDVSLGTDAVLLGEVCIVSHPWSPRGIWFKIRSLFY